MEVGRTAHPRTAHSHTSTAMTDGITYVAPSTTAPTLPNGIIAAESLRGEGDAPGAVAYVHYNGPTDQLATMCTGMCVLEPGASPHPPHTHPEEEHMIVASGTGVIEVDGKRTPVGPGAIMYCAGNVPHGITNTGSTPMTFYWSKWLAKGAQ
jgi:mannose-6-phosphate isomerase-like protein (cupin superfamily)